MFTSLSTVKHNYLDKIQIYVVVVRANSETELPLTGSSLMVSACRDKTPNIYYNAVLFTAAKQAQKHQHEKYLLLLGTSKVYPRLSR